MKELISEFFSITESKKLDYCDIRIENLEHEYISVKNSKLDNLNYTESCGFSVRILLNGCWGFSSSSILNKSEIHSVTKRAIEIAKASSLVKDQKVILSENDVYQDNYHSPCKIDPFKVPLTEKIAFLLSLSEIMDKSAEIKSSEAVMNFFKQKKIFASSEGSFITQNFITSGAGIEVWAGNDDDMQMRTYPANCGGDFQHQGYEFINNLKLAENAERICEEAIQLLSAEQCPSGHKTIILESNQLANQIHESIGHPSEYDRVIGMEASFAGTSFLTEDKLNKLKIGSDIVNVYSDSTIPTALGSYGYDDEGVKAQKVSLVKNGIFNGYLTSRETAGKLGLKSCGGMKSENWNFLPLIRMTNINLEPGSWTLDELISDTEDGIYLCTNKSWSIDDKRWNFQFSTEIAWEIKNGKLGKMYKNPTYTDNTVHFWNSCDAICNEEFWHVWGIPNCGKGQPMQTAQVGHGAAPARFRNIKVGVL